ncbi:MAG: FecR family protein [Lentisphaeraceae bacterium]|nr:FecR family protein [Lentisphaeraceae bacterium]
MNDNLTGKCIEGTLTIREEKTLLKQLEVSSEFTDKLQYNLQVDELLQQTLVKEKSAEIFMAELNKRLKQVAVPNPTRITHTRLQTSKFRARTRKSKKQTFPPLLLAAVAASLLIGFFLFFMNIQSRETQNLVVQTPVKTIQSILAIDEIDGDLEITRNGKSYLAKSGDYLLKGDTLKTKESSTASLKFTNETTEITLKSQSTLLIESSMKKQQPRKVFMVDDGEVFFDVEHQPEDYSFIINTKKSRSKVIGTQLSVKHEDSESSVKVLEGLVRVENTLTNVFVDVPGNHFVSIKDDSYPNVRTLGSDPPKVLSFSLIDTVKSKFSPGYERLNNGVVLKLSELPDEISLRINLSNNHRIMHLMRSFKDSNFKVISSGKELFAPYTMLPDMMEQKAYYGWAPKVGTYYLDIRPFDINGQKLKKYRFTFTIE